MESRKILVTGSAGFMGSWIADALVDEGYEVYGIDNFSGGSIENYSGDYQLFTINLAIAKQVEKVIKKVRPECIFHLASCAREGASQFQPLYVTQTNYQAFMNLIEPAIKYGLEKIVAFSSMSVYGNQKPPFTEDMPRMPEDIYGVNKAAIERSIEILADVHEFDYVIYRPHNVFGARQSLTDKFRNVVAIFMNRIMRKEPLYIYGDGEQVRAFSYIEDSLPCYIRCLDDDIKNEIINIGGMHPITINHLADLVCEAMGVPKIYPREYLPPRPLEVKEAWCSWEKSVKLLGYEEKIGYEEGIRRMAQWAKEKKGPQEWTEEKLALPSEKMPKIWR
ncbi:MAG: NAD-dependent epimerase/dehydratase family protein [Methanophagales archaeon]|nr:NAD-dependent epimerase/dehydratase family protein [Methanophagales archaeon]